MPRRSLAPQVSRRAVKTLLAVILLAAPGLANSRDAGAASGPTITANLSQLGTPLADEANTHIAWDFNSTWISQASGQPANWVVTHYPFLKYAELFEATGGCYTQSSHGAYPGCTTNRDLFVDPSNTSTMTDYDFSRLITATQNVINQGLTPYIVTGNVPIKMSTSPAIGPFGVNLRPPTDYNVYYSYINAMANALASHFGINVVKTWRWGVITELNNTTWFNTGGSQKSTESAYLKLYDYTVAALQAALGSSNLTVGGHLCDGGCPGWKYSDFIDHVAGVGANGTNYFTGGKGTQVNFLTDSFYETAPGNPGDVSAFPPTITDLQSRASADGLSNLYYGIDEGRILNGTDGGPLSIRALGASYQSSWDALYFKKLVNTGASYSARWAVNSNGLWSPDVDSAATNLAQLTYKMAGGANVAVSTSGTPVGSGDIVDGVASYDNASKTAYVLAFNHNPSLSANQAETPAITINNVIPDMGSTVTVTSWLIDDGHAQYWPTWQSDAAACGLTSSDYGVSSPQSESPQTILDTAGKNCFSSHITNYMNLAGLSSTSSPVTPTGNSITLSPSIPQHGVVFYAISNAIP